MDFSSERLRGHRHGVGRELSDVAERADCSVEALVSYESGRAMPSAETIDALAAVLGVPVEEFEPQHSGNAVREYVTAVQWHGEPLSDEDVMAVGTVLRDIRRRSSLPA